MTRRYLFSFFAFLLIAGCSNDDQTEMVICAANNDGRCIIRYLDSNHVVNGHGKEGASPFYAALKNKNFKIADIFVKHNVNLYGFSEGRSYFTLLMAQKNYEGMKYLLSVGYRISPDSPEYKFAQKIGDKRILKLISSGAGRRKPRHPQN